MTLSCGGKGGLLEVAWLVWNDLEYSARPDRLPPTLPEVSVESRGGPVARAPLCLLVREQAMPLGGCLSGLCRLGRPRVPQWGVPQTPQLSLQADLSHPLSSCILLKEGGEPKGSPRILCTRQRPRDLEVGPLEATAPSALVITLQGWGDAWELSRGP